jgi:predicted phosphoribosyltransferase
MYFKNRVEAGKMLADLLTKYKKEPCTVVALSDGAVVVGAQIAARLKCVITLLLAEPINAPGEPTAVASINQEGGYTMNTASYSQGQLDELDMEYHQSFEQSKLEKLAKMHRLIGREDLIRREFLKQHTVILVADGLGDAFLLDAAALYFKPSKLKRLIIATPVANVTAVDRMHLVGDEIFCLGVVENYMGASHYFEENQIPDHETVIATVQTIVANWKE